MPEVLPPVPDPAAPPKRAEDMEHEGDREGPVLADAVPSEIGIERGDTDEKPRTTPAPAPAPVPAGD